MTSESAPARSRYRTVLNVCAAIWFVTCGLLLLCAVALGGICLYLLLSHPFDAAGNDRSDELRRGVYLAVACGLTAVAIVWYGRKYFRRAYERIAEIEALVGHGPRGE